MKFIIVFTISIVVSQILGCNSGNGSYESNDALIHCKGEFVMNDGEQASLYYTNHNNFIKPYLKANYQKDTLTVSTLMEINSCGNSVGDIKISNDTLYLMAKHLSGEKCTSVTFHKFTYLIKNPHNKKYVIISLQ